MIEYTKREKVIITFISLCELMWEHYCQYEVEKSSKENWDYVMSMQENENYEEDSLKMLEMLLDYELVYEEDGEFYKDVESWHKPSLLERFNSIEEIEKEIEDMPIGMLDF